VVSGWGVAIVEFASAPVVLRGIPGLDGDFEERRAPQTRQEIVSGVKQGQRDDGEQQCADELSPPRWPHAQPYFALCCETGLKFRTRSRAAFST
jgi:hypothetical protein